MSQMRRALLILIGLTVLMIVMALPALAYNTGDDYPYKDKGMSGYDPYGFVYRNCTSFVAWCLNSRNGVEFNNWYAGVEWKGAGNWMNAARQLGMTVDNNPAVGTIACESGHVAWVKEVNGNTVTIEEYNWWIPTQGDEGYYDGAFHTRSFDKSHYLGYIHIKDLTSNIAPVGNFEMAIGGTGCIHVGGWARDDDDPDRALVVHIYVGGEANPNTPLYPVIANLYREDVGNHAFDAYVYVSPSGTQTVYAYAIDPEVSGFSTCIGSKTVTIGEDSQPPVISNVQISDVSWKGYTVTCDVSDNVKVAKVAFPTWTVQNGQDDINNDWENQALGTIQNGKATYRVNITDHGKETNCVYRTHIYAYDAAGNSFSVNQSDYPILNVTLPSPITNVRVEDISAAGYTVKCDIDMDWNIQRLEFPTWTEKDGQDDIIWHPGTISNGHASYTVHTSDHNSETDCYYRTHIYIWDANGVSTFVSQNHYEALRVRVPSDMIIMALPADLKVIEEEGFANTDLEAIRLPDGCTTIGTRAFADNANLRKLYIPASVVSISDDAFENCGNLTIYGPENSAAALMAADLGIPFEVLSDY